MRSCIYVRPTVAIFMLRPAQHGFFGEPGPRYHDESSVIKADQAFRDLDLLVSATSLTLVYPLSSGVLVVFRKSAEVCDPLVSDTATRYRG